MDSYQLDQINEKLASIDKTLAVNTAELSHHIEQTNILRTEVKDQHDRLEILASDFNKVRSFFMHVGWAITALATLAGAAYQIHLLVGTYFHK